MVVFVATAHAAPRLDVVVPVSGAVVFSAEVSETTEDVARTRSVDGHLEAGWCGTEPQALRRALPTDPAARWRALDLLWRMLVTCGLGGDARADWAELGRSCMPIRATHAPGPGRRLP